MATEEIEQTLKFLGLEKQQNRVYYRRLLAGGDLAYDFDLTEYDDHWTMRVYFGDYKSQHWIRLIKKQLPDENTERMVEFIRECYNDAFDMMSKVAAVVGEKALTLI